MGTNLLRAYMHGYFIDNRLYQKAKTQLNPFALETYKQEEIDKKIREETKRAPIKKKVKVSGCKKSESVEEISLFKMSLYTPLQVALVFEI